MMNFTIEIQNKTQDQHSAAVFQMFFEWLRVDCLSLTVHALQLAT